MTIPYPDPLMYSDWQSFARALTRSMEAREEREVGKYSPFIPFLVGSDVPGEVTYSVQKGLFKLEFGQLIFSLNLVWTALPTPPTGVELRIGGFPLPAVNEPDIWHNCAMSWDNVMLDAGYNQLVALVPPGQNFAVIRELGSGITPMSLPADAINPEGAISITGSFTTYTAGLTG